MLRHSSERYLLGKPASEKQITLSSILGMLYLVCLKWNSLVDDVIAHKYLSVADSGEGLGEPTPSPSPSRIFTQTEARRAEKRFFGDHLPRFIRVWMTPPPLLPSISRSESGTVYLIKETRGGCVTAG